MNNSSIIVGCILIIFILAYLISYSISKTEITSTDALLICVLIIWIIYIVIDEYIKFYFYRN